jgi:Skp family chaperone for outer membrane proteins
VLEYLAFTRTALVGRIPPPWKPCLICPKAKSAAARLKGEARRVKEDRLQQQGVLKVRKSHLLVALAAGVVVAASLLSMTFHGSDAAAQTPPTRLAGPPPAARPQVTPPLIALLDVACIFKQHVRLKALMDQMKTDVDRAEAWVKNERDAVTKLAERSQDFRPGSPDYKALEEEIAKRRADLAVKIQQQKREFLQREARNYYNVYQEIQQEVNYYCAANGVAVVLRFSREGADVEKPDTVLAYINRPVITYAKDLDITDLILSQLNRRPAGGDTSPVGVRPRPGVPY